MRRPLLLLLLALCSWRCSEEAEAGHMRGHGRSEPMGGLGDAAGDDSGGSPDAGTAGGLAYLADAGQCGIILCGPLTQSLGVGTCTTDGGAECTGVTLDASAGSYVLNAANNAIINAVEGTLETPCSALIQQFRATYDSLYDDPLVAIVGSRCAVGGSGIRDWRIGTDAGAYDDASQAYYECFVTDLIEIQTRMASIDAGCTSGQVIAMYSARQGNADEASIAAGAWSAQAATFYNHATNLIRRSEGDAGVPLQTRNPAWLIDQIGYSNQSGTNTIPNVGYQQQVLVENADGGIELGNMGAFTPHENALVGTHEQSYGYQLTGMLAGRALAQWLGAGILPGIRPTAAAVSNSNTAIDITVSVPTPPLQLSTSWCPNTHPVTPNLYGLEYTQTTVQPFTVTGVSITDDGTTDHVGVVRMQTDGTIYSWGTRAAYNAWTYVANSPGPFAGPSFAPCNDAQQNHSEIVDSGGALIFTPRLSMPTYQWSPSWQLAITGGASTPATESTGRFAFDANNEAINIADSANMECGAACSVGLWWNADTSVNNTRWFHKTAVFTLVRSTASGGGLIVQLNSSAWTGTYLDAAFISTGAWHSLVVVYDGATTNGVYVYLDGRVIAQASTTGTWPASLTDNANTWTWNNTTAGIVGSQEYLHFSTHVLSLAEREDWALYPHHIAAADLEIHYDATYVCTSGSASITNTGDTTMGAITTSNMEAGDCTAGGGP